MKSRSIVLCMEISTGLDNLLAEVKAVTWKE
jgi:hypothetical protein